LTFERDPQGRVTALVLNDDRHEERLAKARLSFQPLTCFLLFGTP